MAILNSIVYLYTIYCVFFVHSSVDGHLGWFRTSVLVNRTAVNIDTRVSLGYAGLDSFGYVHRGGIAGS